MDKEDIRQLIREEISRAFDVLGRVARDVDPYETGERERDFRRFTAMIADRMEGEITQHFHSEFCDAKYTGDCRSECEPVKEEN